MAVLRQPPHVPALTPFDADGSIDEARFRQHLAWLASAGLAIGICGGGSGEGHLLSNRETHQVLSIALDEVGAYASLRALGKEPHTAKEAIEFVHLAQDIGYKAVHLYSANAGHGSRLTEQELETYFNSVLDETTVDVTLSAVNPSSGQIAPVAMLERLAARFENVVGVTCATADVDYLRSLIGSMPPNVGVVSGGPRFAHLNLSLGGAGFGCAEGNVLPHVMRELQSSFLAGDLDTTNERHAWLLKVNDLVTRFGGVRCLKSLMALAGTPMGQPRPPLLPLTASQQDELRDALTDLTWFNPPT